VVGDTGLEPRDLMHVKRFHLSVVLARWEVRA
jgi:hypothetical protein